MDDGDARAETWRLRCQEVSLRHTAVADREVQAAARIAQLEAELAQERATIARMLSSKSWRITEPLRRMRGRGIAPELSPQQHPDDLFEIRMRAAYDARVTSWPQPDPRTFNEKMWHRRLVDRRPILRTYCDKQAVLDRAARLLPAELIPERLAAVDTPDALLGLDLPGEYIVKARHGSGGSAVVWDGPATEGQNWAHPWIRKSYPSSEQPLARVAADLADSLHHDYGWDALEWGYLGVPRQLLVDVLYRGPDGELPDDLRCYVFHGRLQVFEAASDRQRDTLRTAGWHDREWNPLPIAMMVETRPHERPADLDLVIDIAETLAGDEEFVRVDLLMTSEGPKFGEITPYSHGGNAQFRQQSADEYLGSLW